eukprot:g29452.t1
MDVGGESVSRDGNGEIQEEEGDVRNSPGEFEGGVEGVGKVNELLVVFMKARDCTDVVINIAEEEVRDSASVVVEEGLFHESYKEAGIAQAYDHPFGLLEKKCLLRVWILLRTRNNRGPLQAWEKEALSWGKADCIERRCRHMTDTVELRICRENRFSSTIQHSNLISKLLRDQLDAINHSGTSTAPNNEHVTATSADIDDHVTATSNDNPCQLSDISSYCLLNHDPASDHQAVISQSINNPSTSGDLQPTVPNLIVPQLCTALFYLLPKIHKPNC